MHSTFPFMTTPPREGRKALQGHAARTKDARGLLPPAPASVPAPPTPGHLERGASLIEMLPALRVCSRHLAARGAGEGAAGLGRRARRGGRRPSAHVGAGEAGRVSGKPAPPASR
uniref:Uncharacterized protein n=1 Tax=Bos indicus x Bos taurus TaxID=30522 RepID=A0A4W2DRD1_BOBOX